MSDNNAFSIVYKYSMLGRCVIPSGGGPNGKSALIQWKRYQVERPTETQLREWQNRLNPCVWAMPTGPVSGLFAVDCDTKEAVATMQASGLEPHVRTRKGCHYYCKWPSWNISNSSRLLPGIDVRGHGGYVNFCGGNGKARYEVLIWPTDDRLYTFNQLPIELQKALRPRPKTLLERIYCEALDRAQPGNRNETGLWLACQLRDNRVSQSEAEAVMLRYSNQVSAIGLEPYTESEAIDSLEQAFTRPAREPWRTPVSTLDIGSFNQTDLGNAERLVKYYGDILHYCYERGRWLIWNGRVWEWDAGDKIAALAKLTIRNIYHEAGNELDETKRKELVDHAKHSESDHRINAMVNLAQSEPGIPIRITDMDTNPWLLNCLNGTVDLTTGELLPHDKNDLITVACPVKYDPTAQSKLWDKFLNRVFDGNSDLIIYIQRCMGYTLTGDTREQCLFFCWGSGMNGKSTFLNTFREVLAPFSMQADPEMFMTAFRATKSGHSEDVANLAGKRYVLASEIEEGRRLAVNKLKQMTGGERVRASHKHEKEFEFDVTYKIWLNGNHKPEISDSTYSIWRRVKLIPFQLKIPEEEQDKQLIDKLRSEHPAILAWAVQGCLDWQRSGLREPDAVSTATAHYRHEQDILADFIEDCCIIDPLALVPKSIFKEKYQRWCQDNSTEPVTQRTFRARLIEKGITEPRIGKTRFWRGIRIRTDDDVDIADDKSDETSPHSALKVTRGTQNPKSPLMKEKQTHLIETPVTLVTDVTTSNNEDIWADMPDYPHEPCFTCSSTDFWPDFKSKRFVCSRCHPEPEGGNDE